MIRKISILKCNVVVHFLLQGHCDGNYVVQSFSIMFQFKIINFADLNFRKTFFSQTDILVIIDAMTQSLEFRHKKEMFFCPHFSI